MNTVHWRLVLNHFPVIGTMIMGIVLTIAMITKNTGTTMSSYAIIFILSVVAFVVNQTGESAENAVENIKVINKWALHEHEEFAEISTIVQILTGVIALFSLSLSIKRKVISKFLSIIVLLLTYVTIDFMSYTGYLGGQIRHTEVNRQSQNNSIVEPSSNIDEN